MKINTRYESAAFKSCGHTVIIVKTTLPDPMGDSPACERIREFYRELNKIYFSSARAIAQRHGAFLWEENRRPILLLVSFCEIEQKNTEKRRKSRNGYTFLRCETVVGLKGGNKKKTAKDSFFEDSGLIFG